MNDEKNIGPEILGEVPGDFIPPQEENQENQGQEQKKKRGRPKGSTGKKVNPYEAEAEFILQMFEGIKVQVRGEQLNPMLKTVWKNSYINTAEKYGISMNSKPELVLAIASVGLIIDSLGTENTLSMMDKIKIKLFTVFSNLKKLFRRNKNNGSNTKQNNNSNW
ncbi:MAG: hypothetical protein GXO22_04370 [Aquificae bacterium]|nr:hypothetical protein [Aquificota bacterium]